MIGQRGQRGRGGGASRCGQGGTNRKKHTKRGELPGAEPAGLRSSITAFSGRNRHAAVLTGCATVCDSAPLGPSEPAGPDGGRESGQGRPGGAAACPGPAPDRLYRINARIPTAVRAGSAAAGQTGAPRRHPPLLFAGSCSLGAVPEARRRELRRRSGRWGVSGRFTEPAIGMGELPAVFGAASYRQPACWCMFGCILGAGRQESAHARPRREHRALCRWLGADRCPGRHGAHQLVGGVREPIVVACSRAAAGSVALAACS